MADGTKRAGCEGEMLFCSVGFFLNLEFHETDFATDIPLYIGSLPVCTVHSDVSSLMIHISTTVLELMFITCGDLSKRQLGCWRSPVMYHDMFPFSLFI